MILVGNLGKARGSSATIDQIQTYGYVAETTGGSEAESTARRPLDSHRRAARRLRRASHWQVRRGEDPREAHLGGHVRHDAAQDPRLPGALRDRVLAPRPVARPGGGRLDHLRGRARRRRWRRRLVRARLLRRAQAAKADGADRQADAGHDRPARRDDRGRSRHPRVDARRVREHVRPARAGASSHASGAAHGPLGRSGDREPRPPRGRAEHADLRSRDHAGRAARRLDRHDDAEPLASRCASGGGRWPRSARRRCRSRCSSR